MLAFPQPISTNPHFQSAFSLVETALLYILYKIHEVTKCVLRPPRRVEKARQSDVFVEDRSVVAAR
jgi:hypothetical protein